MKINLQAVIYDIDGKAIKDMMDKPQNYEDKRDFTIGVAVIGSLLANFPDEKELPMAEKMRRYGLFKRISKAKKPIIDMPAEELVYIKGLIEKSYISPYITGYIHDLFDAFEKGDFSGKIKEEEDTSEDMLLKSK